MIAYVPYIDLPPVLYMQLVDFILRLGCTIFLDGFAGRSSTSSNYEINRQSDHSMMLLPR